MGKKTYLIEINSWEVEKLKAAMWLFLPGAKLEEQEEAVEAQKPEK